ncbi:glycosyltransferase family 2 protein [Pseudomonas nitroreducens]|uniref:glycosyltransferase family 2 protein n=1 Tax=Pseudomonas nitroreducens TaxID=46680 RepID=UPI0026593DA0|nr:glycosyltransferase family 2 protein [Pseudomonas nitroreducens]MCP1650792.1 glycosyltransferase involved in cell wall biosynthesis [Pseudomonas nitroreducens]MCP1688744.1 glycosyltransferase involved in cell wall biosynthesis [Pseudomonas nitroreducens]
MSASERHPPFISLVVPCFNESAVIAIFHQTLTCYLGQVDCAGYEIVFINDGSRDSTLQCMCELAANDSHIVIIDLARNFGKEAALTAGLDESRGDVVIPMDVDLQDPPEVIGQFLARWREGYDVVLGRRCDRKSDSWIKRFTARAFYSLQNRLADVPLPHDVGDFRLMDRQVIEALKTLPERRRFMKGLFAWVGHRTAIVDYRRDARIAGTSKFSGWKLWNFALEGITSFSTLPLRVWTYLGALIATLSIIYACYIVVRTLIHGVDLPGYASLLASILLLSGIQLIGIGVIGEYIGRIYMESKQRPIYLIRKRYGRSIKQQSVVTHAP